MVGRGIIYNGVQGVVDRVLELDAETPWDAYDGHLVGVELECTVTGSKKKRLSVEDVVLSIRSYEKQVNKHLETLPLPITSKELERAVDLMFEWMALVPVMNAPTAELKARESSHVLVVIPPQQAPISMNCSIIPHRDRVGVMARHVRPQRKAWNRPEDAYVSRLDDLSALNRRGWALFGSLRSSADHIANLHREFSLANAMRGFSLRKRTLRMPCPDHHPKFVRCRCFLHQMAHRTFEWMKE